MWAWLADEDDVPNGDYNAWIGQYDYNSDRYFVFTHSFMIESSGATSLAAASLATVTAIFALL